MHGQKNKQAFYAYPKHIGAYSNPWVAENSIIGESSTTIVESIAAQFGEAEHAIDTTHSTLAITSLLSIEGMGYHSRQLQIATLDPC